MLGGTRDETRSIKAHYDKAASLLVTVGATVTIL
jgi:hypothetical protein